MKTLLFDIGGVLVDVRRDLARERWTQLTGRDGAEFDRVVFGDGRKDAFDRGALDTAAFFAAALADLDGQADPVLRPALEAAFRAIPQPRPWVVPLVAALAGRYRLALLSNIDPIHGAVFTALPVARLFPTAAFSYRIGARKPEPAAYAAALDVLGGPAPERVLLIDDLAPNVAAARAAGLRAAHVPDEAALRALLADLAAGRFPTDA